MLGECIRILSRVKNIAFVLCLDFHPFGFFHYTEDSLLTRGRPAQNSPASPLLLLICLPIQLLLQVTYLTQKIHFFRQPGTPPTIEQQISVIVNSETNLTFNLLAPTRDLKTNHLHRSIVPHKSLYYLVVQQRKCIQPTRIG